MFIPELDTLANKAELNEWLIREFGQSRLSRYFNGKVPEPFGVRNALTNLDVDEIWLKIVAACSSHEYEQQRKARRAIQSCNNRCTPEERQTLLRLAQAGRWSEAELVATDLKNRKDKKRFSELLEKIRHFEATSPFKGREYKKDEYFEIWGWYQDVIYERDDGRCQHCGRVKNLHLDHILPLSKGGESRLTNLQLLCSVCNLKKATRTEYEYPLAIQAAWYKNRRKHGGSTENLGGLIEDQKEQSMKADQPTADKIPIHITKVSDSRIEITYHPTSSVRVTDYFERAAYIGRLQRWSDDLFDLLGTNNEWVGEVEVKPKLPKVS